MNQTRPLLLFALMIVGYFLWMQWQQDYAPHPAPGAAVVTATSNAPAIATTAGNAAVPSARTDTAVPAAAASAAAMVDAARAQPIPAQTASSQRVTVDTDLLHLVIDTAGASIVRAELKAYPDALKSKTPVQLFSDAAADFYVAQTGLVSHAAAAPNHTSVFTVSADQFSLAAGQNSLQVDFRWRDPSGIEVLKRYTLTRGSYVVKLEQTLTNQSATRWTGNAYHQLQRVIPPAPPKHLLSFSDPSQYSFFGAGWYSNKDKFQKLKFDKFESEPINAEVSDGWLAMLQHYFFAAWIPPQGQTDHFSTAVIQNAGQAPRFLIRDTAPSFSVEPGASGSSHAELFIGPKLPNVLKSVAPHFDLAVDYGMLTVLSEPLHWVLAKLHALVGNWGVAIILLLLIIKALFFKLSEAQYRSMAKMRKLQPRIQALKERFGDDKAKMQQAMMELYKKEKANPAAGCLPMLVQIPVFFALYYMLMQSVELRQAPFFGWIQDLSAPDPYFILPIINGLVMLGAQFLTPTTGMDPTQAKIMKFMPVVFSVMFALFPAGLVLYYCTNGLTGLLQQWFIMRRFDQAEAARN